MEQLRICLTRPTITRALMVSLVVGTLITAINQGPAILAGDLPKLWQVVLTYLVPFVVSTFSACSATKASGGE